MNRKRVASRALVGFLLLVLVGSLGLDWFLRSGGMRARQEPSAAEKAIADRLVTWGIPSEARARPNPLPTPATEADLAAGRDLYAQHCAACHGYDGAGKTAAGGGMYPPPTPLRGDAVAKRTDGELFYLVRNGIRNTGMPGWQLPDDPTWQLVEYIRHLPLVATVGATDRPAPSVHPGAGAGRTYVGSAACAHCHQGIYDRWKTTLMANVVRDPREHPDAITPDLSTGGPLVTFTAADVAFVYGTRWKQRYFKRVDGDYYPYPAQWDVTHKTWKPYFVKDDWWAPLYPPDNFARPTSALCDGCHSVNYDIKTRTVTEWNVGCERCHGPGSEHARDSAAASIVDPARLDYVAAADVCIQCHSQGRPLNNPIDGKYYDWPVGYDVGAGALRDVWKLEEHKLGETTFAHFADGTAHKNRMQGNDFVTSAMYTHGVSCFTCHDAHGSRIEGMLRKPADTLCLDCHGPKSPNGPHAATLEEHSHHKAGSPGNACVSCHMPKIAQTIGDVNVRSHTFRFVSPARTDALKIPNACNVCHTDKTTAWAADALRTWTERSPWRMND
jgi:predicted CXXCH cytochrome family protein